MDMENIKIEDAGLSRRSENALRRVGVYTVGDMLHLTEEELYNVRNLGKKSVDEILEKIKVFQERMRIQNFGQNLTEDAEQKNITVFEMSTAPKYRDLLREYVQTNDMTLQEMGLSTRPMNRLKDHGCKNASDVIMLGRQEIQSLPSLGAKSIAEINNWVHEYLSKHEARIMAVCQGDKAALWDDTVIRQRILDLYQQRGFGGYSLSEMREQLALPDLITVDRLKKIIGGLLASQELEYVDYRCYRIYGKFEDYLQKCDQITDRNRMFLQRRLQGETLESIGKSVNLTRERIRQIVSREVAKIRNWYVAKTGLKWFDEDYYRYFYETYYFDVKDGSRWLGISQHVWRYLALNDAKQGSRNLKEALDDHENLEAGLRIKISNYLNRNKAFVDGIWVEKRRADLEDVAVKRLCKDSVSFSDFANMYNEFLDQEGVPYDDSIYYTESVLRTRSNRLAESRMLLWKYNEQIRYYDIDAYDYTELFDTLNLDSYEDIELSTLKFIEDYPDLMIKYDIRDQYELHNLLKKVVPEGSFHDFHCKRMPMIQFGTFDRDAAIFDLMIDNAPISAEDLADIVHAEYGYEQATIIATYLPVLRSYYHQGKYTIDQKVMAEEKRHRLMGRLADDFYYIYEIRKIYSELFPDGDLEEINPFNLKEMGYTVLSRYVVKEQTSLEQYFTNLLTGEDIVDISGYRRRFVYVQAFSAVLSELRRNLEIIEFEPNVMINMRKLKQSGVSRDQIEAYCDMVYDYIDEGTYFSAQSLRKSGFETELYDLGFSDWFYGNLLISDERFSYENMFGILILYKGKQQITRKSFITDRIRAHGSIDVYDLMNELRDLYGCQVDDAKRYEITKVHAAEICYDSCLDRLYADEELYYRELDMAEGI